MLKIFRRHLATKFFISYLIVILIGIVVLITATEFIVPSAFDRHMAEMTALMGPSASELENDLFRMKTKEKQLEQEILEFKKKLK